MNPLNERDEELKDSPLLRSLQGREPFISPEGYEEELITSVQQRISTASAPVQLYRRPALLAIPILAAAITAFFFLHKPAEQQAKTTEFAATYDDLIESGYYTEIDETTLCESLEKHTVVSDTSTADIEEYLINNTDESLLENAL